MIAMIFGFSAGIVILARLCKSYLQDQEYFRSKDRECNMLFGVWGDKTTEDKFSIDLAAAAHRNRQRASNEYASEVEMTESPGG